MESWRLVWRDGFEPVLSDAALVALADGLRGDDCRIAQGSTVTPPPLMCVQDWPVEGACCLGYAGWHGEGLTTVGQVEEFFARCCHEADQRLGEPAACRWFLDWFDDTPRDRMRAELLAEVELALRGRRVWLAKLAESVGLLEHAPWWIVADVLDDAEGREADAARVRAIYGQEGAPCRS